jgi:hypothetical protein
MALTRTADPLQELSDVGDASNENACELSAPKCAESVEGRHTSRSRLGDVVIRTFQSFMVLSFVTRSCGFV